MVGWVMFIPGVTQESSRWGGMLHYLNYFTSVPSQSVEAAKDAVFPSRVLKRQLEDAHERLRQMEDELRTLKENEGDTKRQKMEIVRK